MAQIITDAGSDSSRKTAQESTQSETSELAQARLEGAAASDTRRAIASAGSTRFLDDSINVRVGKQFIDGAFDTADVAQVRAVAQHLTWNSPEERKALAAYAMKKLQAIDPDAEDAAVAALVMLNIFQHLMPDKAEEIVPLMQTTRKKVEQRLYISRGSDLADIAHTVKAAQIVGDLGTEADLALERRVLASARARLHGVEPATIERFISSKLELHNEQRTADEGLLREEFEQSLGYRSKILNGSFVLVRGAPAKGYEELARQVQRHRGEYYYTTDSGERWRVAPSFRVGMDSMVSLERESGEGSVTLRRSGLIEMLKKQDLDQYLHTIATQAVADGRPDARTNLRKHDLTQNGTAYITVTPQKYDIVTAASVTYAALLENVLMRRYGRAVEPIHIVSNSPIDEIRAAIRDSLKRAPQIKDIFLQLHEHGAPYGIGFSPEIKAEDLAVLSEEFPNVDLHVMTIACFGGGLRPALQREMEKNPSLKRRLHFYSHTQPEVEALALGTGGSKHIYDVEMSSTPYMLMLIKKLAEGRAATFGEAVDEADRESQRTAPINPETLLNGEFFGKSHQPSNNERHA